MKVAGKEITTFDVLIAFILYGDIHEAPLALLGDEYNKALEQTGIHGFNTEQATRLAIAASLKAMEKSICVKKSTK